ncbi:fibronectin type III domain-containing protein [Cellvibrio japonicus]|uniref:Pectin methylesterase, putative, ce8 n=1 Tax=Cellvibrio japonicus (strain Ueda107) TaxID=498211 RepID=B3PFC4_CELJU|nr:fibronectin type III domain-containing protein [Cellvibrio japonicus]ACE83168.1 pectin methylesterase, putative, ce8 [Cellvibrio japonicus Ueda107]QEI10799.1 fibronectin type III domain-containing protein [Cellvibrio japonicus]QEI14375.1 fibronectin type III domain-containing protein [Cellvibrio japonicus]QEI17953.1 fibronectin type III domain-containing protein [Cellvibrio japonicus]
MKNINLFTIAFLGAGLVACGGGDGGPKKPDICQELNQEKCNEIVIPESSSSASSEYVEVTPSNNLLPIIESFNVDNASSFFSESYKSLVTINPEDPNNALFYATSGLSEGRIAVENGKLTIGNARFTIGQTLNTTGTHLNPTNTYSDYKVGTTAAADATFPMTDSWGDLDLRNNWKISFCVVEREELAGSTGNQSFYVMLDNNQSTIAPSTSIHGDRSSVFQARVSSFAVGKRVEINIPGEARSNGVLISSTSRIGLEKSFLQFRVPSAGILTMSQLWIGYQSDTSTEPTNATCAAGERVSTYLKPLPPVAPAEVTLQPGAGQLRVTWSDSARATSYDLAYGLTENLEEATTVTGLSQTPYTITGLENGTTYYVWVRAANATGASDWSAPFTGIPEVPAVAPETPTGLTVYGDNQRAVVFWEATEGTESYSLALNTMNDTGTAEVTTGITDTYKLLTGLVNNTPYYVFVKAGNAVGDSEYTSAQVVTPSASPYIYQANLAVSKDFFFGTNGPALQTLGVDSEVPMHFVAGGNAGITLEEGGIRLANGGRFTIGQVVVPNDEGVLTQTNTTASDTSVNGVLDLSGYYKIVINVVSAPDNAGLFQVYLDNNTTSGGSSIHQTTAASRLINRTASTIADGEEIVYEMSANRRGTSTSFIQLRVDSALGAEGILISGIRIEEIDPPAASSSSEASSSVESSSSSSSVASSESSVASSSETSSSSSSSEASSEASSESSSSSSELNGGTSSESSSSSSVAASALLTEAFTAADTATFFSADYKAMPADAGKALYRALAGESRITLSDGQLSLNNARFSIGDLSEGVATTGSAQPNGAFDLSQPYRIKFTILAATGTGNFQVYVDNNTTSAGNSIHTTTESTTVSRLLQVSPSSITSFPYDVVIESSVGTPNSFFQIRADSNITNLVIDNLVIEYQ